MNKRRMARIIFSVFFSLFGLYIGAQNSYSISWHKVDEPDNVDMLWFEGASSGTQSLQAPSFCSDIYADFDAEPEISNAVWQNLSESEFRKLNGYNASSDVLIEFATKNNVVTFCFIPLRRNPQTGMIQKLLAFEIELKKTSKSNPIYFKTSGTDTSMLAEGNWYRVGVTNTGVFKITPQFLADCGLGNSAPSNQIRVFGNGAGMLSELNDNNPNPGLKEVALYVNDGGDSVFDGNDYALFYAVGPHKWRFQEANPQVQNDYDRYEHSYNIYSESSYYFITVDNGLGKRLDSVNYNPVSPNYITQTFDDFAFIEDEQVNLVGTGRRWFGDLFDFKPSYDYTFQFNNVDQTDTAWFTTNAVARSLVSGTSINFSVNSNNLAQLIFPSVLSHSGAAYVQEKMARNYFIPSGNTFSVTATYNKNGNASATAWMDYMRMVVRRNLILSGSGLVFRDKRAFKNGGFAQFNLTGANSGLVVWDVTDHINARYVPVNNSGGNASIIAPSDSLRTFVAIQGANFPLPSKVGAVANQNLHGLEDVDMVIVAHPSFTSEANRLADFHINQDGMNVVVATPQEVYNEFSSGMQDITAIKLLMRHLYKKNSSKPVSHLLLFGDASYDYKNRMPNMHNFVPIYQSLGSYSLYSSYCTDDFFGYLEDGEGKHMLFEDLDIGIGRLPVKNLAEAKAAVDKIIHYSTNPECFGDWRNRVMLISDDVDEASNWEMQFVENMDRLAREIDTVIPNLNINKVYIDSYIQIVRAGSQRYPDARDNIFRNVERGNLVTSYLGHGGEVGWAKERILQLADVNGWDNKNNMPVFTTVTCEFTRIDDPERVSAGEQLFLNPNGGAAALYSTMRPVFATQSTYNISNLLFEFMFYQNNGEFLTLGEVNRATKNANNSGDRVRFALIGDPAMKLAIPKYHVVTDSVNGVDISQFADTLKALSKVTVQGHVEDLNGNVITGFNGIINPTVFDKKSDKATLMNDGNGYVFNYKSRENIIYRGKSSVDQGLFKFEFVVPLDINFTVGSGKFSYYATDSLVDAGGNDGDILIGGLNLDAEPDDKGPLVDVFINDTNFISGGLTDRNPTGLGLISDSSGINTVGSGIGHDIIGILDGNTGSPFILNDYFRSDLNSFQSGTVEYPFFNLNAGNHNLLIRAWDVNNNMGQGEVDFIVDDSHSLALEKVLNYPNPFSKLTRFQFEHNRAGEPLEVDVQIFNSEGRLVHRIKRNLISTGNRVNEITWDGTSEGGKPLGSGVFLYRVKVKSTEDGSSAQGYSKLVFVK